MCQTPVPITLRLAVDLGWRRPFSGLLFMTAVATAVDLVCMATVTVVLVVSVGVQRETARQLSRVVHFAMF